MMNIQSDVQHLRRLRAQEEVTDLSLAPLDSSISSLSFPVGTTTNKTTDDKNDGSLSRIFSRKLNLQSSSSRFLQSLSPNMSHRLSPKTRKDKLVIGKNLKKKELSDLLIFSGISVKEQNAPADQHKQIHDHDINNRSQVSRKGASFARNVVASRHEYPLSLTVVEKKQVYYDAKEITQLQEKIRQEYTEYQQKKQLQQQKQNQLNDDHEMGIAEMMHSSAGEIMNDNSFTIRGLERSHLVNPRSNAISMIQHQNLVKNIIQEQAKLRKQQNLSGITTNSNEDDTIEEKLRRLSISMTRTDLFFAKQAAQQDYYDAYPDAIKANTSLSIQMDKDTRNDSSSNVAISQPHSDNIIESQQIEAITLPDHDDKDDMSVLTLETHENFGEENSLHQHNLQPPSQYVSQHVSQQQIQLQDVELHNQNKDEDDHCDDNTNARHTRDLTTTRELVQSETETTAMMHHQLEEPMQVPISPSPSKKTKKKVGGTSAQSKNDLLLMLEPPSPYHSTKKWKQRNDTLLNQSWHEPMVSNLSSTHDRNTSLGYSEHSPTTSAKRRNRIDRVDI